MARRDLRNRRAPLGRLTLLAAALLSLLGGVAGVGAERGERRLVAAGKSVEGRPIEAVARGTRGAPVRVLVIGSIHGNETAGQAVIRALRRSEPPRGVELFTLRTANPDGVAAGTRQNARGVDLNRNFPYRWRRAGHPFTTYYSGTRPFSEPESRAIRRVVATIRPTLTVWYHQALGLVDLGSGADRELVRSYARLSGLPARRIAFLPGVETRWQNHRFPRTNSFVVELPAGRLSPEATARHARAVLRVARTAKAAIARPPIRQWRIPFGPRRKHEMRLCALRHYGINDFRLRRPRVIVLHLSLAANARAVYNTFAPDRPDRELGELPGVCSHFVVDGEGRIFQLVSLRLMCRHTVGLNYVAFGIEHVGFHEAQVFGRQKQLSASLRLVRWLQAKYGIRTRDVIGHNESLESPYHRERVRRVRRQTHSDFPTPWAARYRRLLAGGH